MFSSLRIKAVNFTIACFLIIAFTSTHNAMSQTTSDKSLDTIATSEYSPYYLGVLGGYTGLFKDSKLAENVNATDFIHGTSIGFSFDYKLPGTSSFIQLLTENNRLNFKNDDGDNYQNLRFTTLGLKLHPIIIENLYFSIGMGIMTGSDISTQMIMSMYLGYDFIKDKNKTYFVQIGTYGTDFNDNIILVRFGIRINL